jgi:dTDP-6-deoxy-L-talose 4-dehydrogenase (NAD+)
MSLILLTGSTGFVGRQILKILQERGYRLRLVIRQGSQSKIVNMYGVESILTTSDLFSETSLWWEAACDGVDAIIHCAWYAEPGKYLRSDKNLDCLLGTINLAKGAATAGVRRFVGIGTCFEYEMSSEPLDVSAALQPLSPYAAAKVACFIFLSEYFRNKSIQFTWCRLFYLYGDGEDPRRLVPYVRQKIENNEIVELTEGGQIRDFLDTKDAGQQIIALFESGKSGAVNICSGIGISVKALAEKIAGEYGRGALLKFGARKADPSDPLHVVGVKDNFLHDS